MRSMIVKRLEFFYVLFLAFVKIWGKIVFKNIFQKESVIGLLLLSGVQTNECPMRLKLISTGSELLGHREYDPFIIERTMGFALGSSTAMYRLFLKHCTP